MWVFSSKSIDLSEAFNTDIPQINFTFPEDGEYTVRLSVNNTVSRVLTNMKIVTQTLMKPIRLFCSSGMSNGISASKEGEVANFLYTYQAGTKFKCNVDFGDESSLQFSALSESSKWNNSIFPHLYEEEGNYNVTIICKNLLNSGVYSTFHYVEKKIANIQLISTRTSINTPFQLVFKLSGSNPVFNLTFDGAHIPDIEFDKATGLARTVGQIAGRPENMYRIELRVENSVSSAEFHAWFQSGGPIAAPILKIQQVQDKFRFTTFVVYSVNVQQGSNVNVKVFYGDEADDEQPTENIQIFGAWQEPLVLNHTHSIPGTFQMRVLLSNSFNAFTLYQNVTIFTGCSGLLPILESQPVINTPIGSVAVFRFSYLSQKSGADAFIEYWPGDARNESHGPFLLAMNFHENITKNTFSYRYLSDGNFNAVFRIYNTIESVDYSLKVQVTRGVFGLTLDTDRPYLNVGDSFDVFAYMIQATENTKFDWEFQGVLTTTQRICKQNQPKLISRILLSDR